MNIPALAESDLAFTIEGDFAVPVTLIDPEGTFIEQSLNGGRLRGKVRWARVAASADGVPFSVDAPALTLRRSSLPRIPQSHREQWVVIMPSGPREDAPLEYWELDKGSSVEGGRTLGKITLPLVKLRPPVRLELEFRITPEGMLQYRVSDPRVRFRVSGNNLEYIGPDGFTARVETDKHCWWRTENAAA
jgi:hypothetical protein